VGQREKAAYAILDFDPTGNHVGSNVAMRHRQARGTAWALMSDFIDRYRSKHGGLTRNTVGLRDVVKGLFGEDTTPQARALAEGIGKARDYLVTRANLAGADIQRRQDWGWVQRHDSTAIKRAGLEAWSAFVLPRLDPSRMYNFAGQRMSPKELAQAVRGAYETLTTGDLAGLADLPPEIARFDSPVNRRVHHRELAFRDAEAWLEYQERFGDPDLFGSIVGEIDRLARDVAQLEILGPYPKATLEAIQQTIAPEVKAAGRQRSRFLDNVFEVVTGQSNNAERQWFANFNATNRSLITGARLGGAVFVSLADFATNALTARMNGVPVTGLLRELFAQLNPADGSHRRMAARMGYIAETWAGSQVGAQRLVGEVTGLPSVARITDSVLRLSGLNAWTDGGRAAFSLELVGHMTDQAGKPWDQVEPALRGSLERHGITPEDWDRYRSTSIWSDPETGAEFIRPEDTYREVANAPAGLFTTEQRKAHFDTAQKFGEMIHQESLFAVVTPTARSRALITQGTRPGTVSGEVMRNLALFKSFVVTHTYLHMSRMMAQRGLAGKAQYLAWITIGMTAAGAIAEQASSVYRGKDLKDMDDPKFWLSAIARGGSLGPLGDFLYAGIGGTNRFGDSIVAAMAGPVGSEVEALANLVGGNLSELAQKGEARNVGSELVRFAEGLLPGNSLWYSRLAFDRMLKDELVAYVDGGEAERRFRRIERMARREYNQKYWWRPGKPLPSRPPA
jgi:hypothetical protein